MLPRVALVILGVLVIAIVGIGVWFYTGGPFGVWRKQMAIGATYMKSLKDSDVPPWIERTKRLLAEWSPSLHPVGAYGLGGKPVPADLQQLGIIRVDILEDQVRYVWMGGMDHTELEVDRLPDGSFRFIAHYNDYKSEVIWPKGPNHAMERTAARRVSTFFMTKTHSLRSVLALGGGRSSWSR
jgi:hypothetical protein